MSDGTSATVAAGAGVRLVTAPLDATVTALRPCPELRQVIADAVGPINDHDPAAETGSARHSLHRWLDRIVRPRPDLAHAFGGLP